MDSPEILGEVEAGRLLFKCGYQVEAIKKLARLEEAGSGNAAYYLHLIYKDGFECSFVQKLLGYGKADALLANDYFTKAIERNSSFAQSDLTCAYYYR